MTGYTVPLNIPYPTNSDSLRSAVQVTPQLLAERINDLLNAFAPVASTAWLTPPHEASWSAIQTRYARTAGMTTLIVNAANGSAIASGQLICTLPAGYRPTRLVPAGAYNSATGAWFPFSVAINGEVRTAIAGANGIAGTVSFPSS